MASLNRVEIIGNLGNDPEIKYLANGDAVASISVATTEKWKDKQSGEVKEAVEWHRVSLWRRLGEIAGEYLKKGSQVYIAGKLKTRKWQHKDGIDRYTTEIVASELLMLSDRRDDPRSNDTENPKARRQEAQQRPTQNRVPSGGGFDEMDDDIPFMRPAALDGIPFRRDGAALI